MPGNGMPEDCVGKCFTTAKQMRERSGMEDFRSNTLFVHIMFVHFVLYISRLFIFVLYISYTR